MQNRKSSKTGHNKNKMTVKKFCKSAPGIFDTNIFALHTKKIFSFSFKNIKIKQDFKIKTILKFTHPETFQQEHVNNRF